MPHLGSTRRNLLALFPTTEWLSRTTKESQLQRRWPRFSARVVVQFAAMMRPKEVDMHRVEESVVINRPREEVWDYVTNPANFTSWMSNMVEFDADWEQEPAIGDTYRVVEKVAGRRFEGEAEITGIDPGQMFATRTVSASFRVENVWKFEQTGEGTHLTFHGETPGPGGFLGKIVGRIMIYMFIQPQNALQLREPQDHP